MSASKDKGRKQQSPAGNRQGAESSQQSTQQSGSGIHSDFAHASPESNVNPPGAPQSSAGSIAGNKGADVPGGVASQIQASRNAQSGKGGSASGSQGTSADGSLADDGRSVVHSSGGAGMDRDS